MSEQIELEDSNLCISEDAFEKFQAISMYEENKYIALPNTVPTKPPEKEFSDDTKITSCGDTMIKFNPDDKVYVNTRNCDGEQQIPPKYKLAANTDSTLPSSGDSNRSTVTSKHGKKRGRKKKTITESSENVTENRSECVNVVDRTGPSESIEDIQRFIQTTEPEYMAKRQERKSKHYNICSDDSTSSKEKAKKSIPDKPSPLSRTERVTTVGKKLPKRRVQSRQSIESSITNMSSSNEDEQAVGVTEQSELTDTRESSKRKMKKRGRPKKTSEEVVTNQTETLNTVDNPTLPNIVDSLRETVITIQPKKRGRPKKQRNKKQLLVEGGSENNVTLHNASIENDDEICLSKITSRKSDSDEGLDNEDKIELNDLLENDSDPRKIYNEEHEMTNKKRGRPRKVVSETASQATKEKESHSDSGVNIKSHEDGDELSLSEFKKALEAKVATQKSVKNFKAKDIQQPSEAEANSKKNDEPIQSSGKRNSKMPIMSDFEYNLDNIVSENIETEKTDTLKDDLNSLLIEDTSRRPTRKKIRQALQYHEESDEDPFANVELSDDEPQKKRKSRRYNSDDEYFPGDKRGPATPSSSDSEINTGLDTDKKNRKRKSSKKSDSQSPRKRGRKPIPEKIVEKEGTSEQTIRDDLVVSDIEDCLHSSVIKTNDETSKAWGTTKEFENFLAKKIQGTNLKIKKVSSSENADAIAPLQIPTIDPNEVKKTIEMCTQTSKISTSNVQVQTGSLYEIPMKETVALTEEQSTKSCEFLSSIVNTTAELGKLMTQKSEDFIKKKINTAHVTDTFKMDYCVRKSFLLFKLAKHNLTQMEEDLAKQYEQFLDEHDLLKYREQPKEILPTSKVDSDSDCEIVEEPQEQNVNKTPKYEKFNPKTVFLNKELSIKIAKKPSFDKNINIKGKHTVWINDSVMVKKVKPTQSFLAQDSRNKKPPDQNYVTTKMVSDFFEDYYRKKSLATCALFTSPDWLDLNNIYICNYFVTKQDFVTSVNNNNETTTLALNRSSTTATTDTNQNTVKTTLKISETISPQELMILCTKVLSKCLHTSCLGMKITNSDIHNSHNIKRQPKSLIKLCINSINNTTTDLNANMHNLLTEKQVVIKKPVPTLKSLSHKKVTELFFDFATSHDTIQKSESDDYLENKKLYKNNESAIIKQHEKNMKSLFSLCVDCFQFRNDSWKGPNPKTIQQKKQVKPLFSLCFESIRHISGSPNKNFETVCLETNNYKDQIIHRKTKENRIKLKTLFTLCVETINLRYIDSMVETIEPAVNQHRGNIKTLFSLCIECIQDIQMAQKSVSRKIEIQISPSLLYTAKSLKQICLNYMSELLFNVQDYTCINQSEPIEPIYSNNYLTEAFTINSVNTLSEEAFHNLQNTSEDHYYGDYDNEEPYLSNDDYESHFEEIEEHDTQENNWADQVQMKELRSCANTNTIIDTQDIVNDDVLDSPVAIKTEPIEDVYENMHGSVSVKIEPLNELNEMSVISGNVYTKSEVLVHSQPIDHSPRLTSISYPVETFEEFLRTSKLINPLDNDADSEVYTQSNFRVRKQFEPDYNGENEEIERIDGLLVPHTYTNIYRAKDCLMESSSDEKCTNKGTGKKRPPKRKVKPKKTITKTSSKDVTQRAKEKSKLGAREVDEFTRKMKDRIRQEQNDRQSSESESDDLPLGRRRNKENVKDTNKKLTLDQSTKNAIQCNDVDSTEQISNLYTSIITNDNATKGSSNAIVQNNSSNTTNSIKTRSHRNSCTSCDFQGPLELLECEPSIHEDGDDNAQNLLELLTKSINDSVTESNNDIKESDNICTTNEELATQESPKIINHFGWTCYPINTKDSKLYRDCFVLLDRLPESFVQTYLQYQEITKQTEVDKEIDRLTNVNSLNRISKEKSKSKLRLKNVVVENSKSNQRGTNSDDSEQAREFAPSDDDDAYIAVEQTPPMLQKHADNILAKSSLMDDETDEEKKVLSPKATSVKREPVDEAPVTKRPGPKSKTRVEPTVPEGELILTADKMMKEELTLLHAPVNMETNEANGADSMHTESFIRTRSKGVRKPMYKIKFEDDSSSEEEKQWVSTKEKLLKRLKKAPDASASDAKRAKMVTEFIEKRGDGSDNRKVKIKYRASRKKYLEREKQVKVLSKELYGESSSDTVHPRKSYVTMNYKGRRNIRKVIDKKSLEISTLKANIEELERKRRLNDRQNQLREHLGCEDNVNVLVINDEVCLEYDFDEDQPAVTVHAFFTKVMKAHQYEGVKFMWDACFESLSKVRSGHAGGGCILAHCMGLGKTLQVLALLHTVLTHPQVGMKRVLVCCPLSTVLNWVDEIHKWIGPVTDQLKVFELSKLKKTYERAYQLEDWYNGGGIFIIGYELFRSLTTLDSGIDQVRPTIVKKIRTALLDPGPDIVVCDEGHLLKNDCSVLAVAMSRVATRRRIVLTGTPMQNNLREYYCMVNFIKPNLLGSYAEYSNRFANPIMNGQHRDSSEEDIKLMKTRTHILHKVLEGCLQRQEASVLYPYLPKKHEYTVFIPLTKCQWDLYKHYLYTYCKQNKQGILKDFHILQKIWSHPQVLHNFHTKLIDHRRTKEEKLEDDLAAEDLSVDDIKPTDTEVWWLQYLDGGNMLESLESSNKFVAVFRILNECVALGDKVLIFSTSLFCLDTLEYFLKKINSWSLGQEYYRLDGSVPAEVRHKWCREFNADNNVKTKLFLISTRAGSLGLNMTAANRVIILDTSWNPAHDMQSIFRVYRFGQKKDCFIYRLVAMGTMEQKIYERSVTKQAVACRVVDEQQIDRHYNSADLAELYRLDEAGGSVSGGVAAGVRDVALLRVARDGPVHAVHEHDSLLRASEPALPEHERAAAWHQFQLERAAQPTNVPTTKKSKISAKSVQNAKPKTVILESNEIDTQEPRISKDEDVINGCIPSTSEKPVFFADDSIKNEIANNVVHALLKHNFPNMVEIKDVTAVVTAVQTILRNVQANEENKINVTTVIVKVMFEHVNEPLPQLVNTVLQNLNANIEAEKKTVQMKQTEHPDATTPVAQKKSERLKEKQEDRQLRSRSKLRDYIQETLPESHKSTKRKKKDKTQKKRNATDVNWATSTPDMLIRLKDNDRSSHETLKPVSVDECVELIEKPGPLSKKKNKKVQKQTKNLIEAVGQPEPSNAVLQLETTDAVELIEPPITMAQPQPVPNECSILLSDDDDVTVVHTTLPLTNTSLTSDNRNLKPIEVIDSVNQPTPKRVNPKHPKTIIDTRKLSTSKEKAVKETQNTEPVPLHPSLLTNKNFITIVAHKYLEATPLLDEDAATLAAQYSTQKAKKEMEETGKSITSGPLYDIALNLLGIDTLKKLNKATPKVTKSKRKEAAPTMHMQESIYDLEKPSGSTILKLDNAQSLKSAPKARTLPKQPTKKTSRIRKHTPVVEKPLNSAVPAPAPQPTTSITTSNVVPVELFKGPSMTATNQYPQQNIEECILPDDDDTPSTFAGVPQLPQQTSTPSNAADAKAVPNQEKARSIILRTMLTKPGPRLQPVSIQTATIAPKSSPVGELKSMISTVGGQIVVDASQLNNTICLDSDEEEPEPVPVALTRVNPQRVIPITHLNPKQAMPITRVVASSAPTPSSSSFVNVSAGSSINTYSTSVSTPISVYTQSAGNTPMSFTVSTPSNTFVSPTNISPTVLAVTATTTPNTHTENQPVVRSSSSPHRTDQVVLPKTTIPEETLATKASKSNQFILKINNQSLKVVQTTPPPESVKSVIKLGKDDKLIPNAVDEDLPVSKELNKTDQSSVSAEPLTKKATPSQPSKNITSKRSVEPSTSRRSSSAYISNDSDTPSSSAQCDDPLDILKDIVHIQAYTNEKKQDEKSARNKGKTTKELKSSTNKVKSTSDATTLHFNLKNKTDVKLSTSENKKPPTYRKIAAKPSSTELVLRFTADTIKSSSNTLKKQSSAHASSSTKDTDNLIIKAKDIMNIKFDNPKAKSSSKAAQNVIDLTSYVVEPSKSKDSKNSKKHIHDKSKSTVGNATNNDSSIEKPALNLVKSSLTAVVDITGESTKSKISTRTKSSAQHTSTNDKKRPSTSTDTKPTKKKKVKELTLQDFNIDDLDDIIELE